MGKKLKILFILLVFFTCFSIFVTKPAPAKAQADCGYDYACYHSQTCYSYTPYSCFTGYVPSFCVDSNGFWYVCYLPTWGTCWASTPYDCGYWGTCHQYVACPEPPVVTFGAIPSTVAYNGSSILYWSATNATSCYAIPWWQGFSGYLATGGTYTINNLTTSQWFTIQCTGPAGSTNAWVYVTVNPPTPPVVTFGAIPSTVEQNGSTVLYWNATNATSCYAVPWWQGFSGNLATGGTYTLTNLTTSQWFAIQCTGAGGSTNGWVYVTVNPGVQSQQQTCINGQWVTQTQTCVAQSTCNPICVPTTCAAAGNKNCGFIDKGCPPPNNGTINCGSCTSPDTCGGGGTPNVCGCIPTTSCAVQGRVCGTIFDGCKTVACGSNNGACLNNQVCINGQCTSSITGAIQTESGGDLCTSGVRFTTPLTLSANLTNTTSNATGDYTFSNLLSGAYNVTLSVPAGYRVVAINGGATNLNFTSVSLPPNASVNFCISNVSPWIQSIGSDIRQDSGFSQQIPASASCGAYASIPGGGGSSGIIYSGASNADFGSGQASATNWIAGGTNYPESYSPTRPNLIRTSYNYLVSVAKQAGITPIDMASFSVCGAGGINNCTLPNNLPDGLYIANGNLNITGGGYTFPANKNFVILVHGDLDLKEQLHEPSGTTATFSVSGNIIVDRSVGEITPSSTSSDIEGFYSADKNFIVDGNNNCVTGADKRLNLAGAVVVNAALGGGTFQNNRNLCAGNASCPAFSVIERPDFVLNAPDFIKHPSSTWQESAP